MGWTEATSIDHSPKKAVDWKESQNVVEIQQKCEDEHLDDECMQCPMSHQFEGGEFCSNLENFQLLRLWQRGTKK